MWLCNRIDFGLPYASSGAANSSGDFGDELLDGAPDAGSNPCVVASVTGAQRDE
jgi:hypothetical protein